MNAKTMEIESSVLLLGSDCFIDIRIMQHLFFKSVRLGEAVIQEVVKEAGERLAYVVQYCTVRQFVEIVN